MLGRNENILLIFMINNDGWINMSDLKRETKLGQAAIASAITEIKLNKLVDEQRGDRNSREFRLNSKGRGIAEDVLKLQEKLLE